MYIKVGTIGGRARPALKKAHRRVASRKSKPGSQHSVRRIRRPAGGRAPAARARRPFTGGRAMRLAVPALALLSLLALLRAHGATAPSVAGSSLGLERASTGAQTLAAEAAVAAAEAAVAAAEAAAAVAEERRLDPDASSTAEVAREQGGATPEASHSGSVHAAPDSSTRRATDGGGGTRSHSHGEVRGRSDGGVLPGRRFPGAFREPSRSLPCRCAPRGRRSGRCR